jgi:hypothetical protein
MRKIMRKNPHCTNPFKLPAKLGRNDECFCGSKKKLKNCCIGKYDNIRDYYKAKSTGLIKTEAK